MTSMGSIALLDAGRFRNHRSMRVTQRINIAINITIAAGTSVGGVALLGTSRLSHDCNIVMTGGPNHLGFKVVATDTIMALFTFYSASRCLSSIPFTILVAQCVHIGIHIGIATMAGMGGITLLGTSRFANYCRMCVRKRNYISVVFSTTIYTAIACVSIIPTIRLHLLYKTIHANPYRTVANFY